jgi:ESCRT-II complex subunit
MASPAGGERVEWVGVAKGKTSERCWVYWRRPEEWAGVVEGWVEGTGQKGTVLTLYEIGEGDASRGQGMGFFKNSPLFQPRTKMLIADCRVSWNGSRVTSEIVTSMR